MNSTMTQTPNLLRAFSLMMLAAFAGCGGGGGSGSSAATAEGSPVNTAPATQTATLTEFIAPRDIAIYEVDGLSVTAAANEVLVTVKSSSTPELIASLKAKIENSRGRIVAFHPGLHTFQISTPDGNTALQLINSLSDDSTVLNAGLNLKTTSQATMCNEPNNTSGPFDATWWRANINMLGVAAIEPIATASPLLGIVDHGFIDSLIGPGSDYVGYLPRTRFSEIVNPGIGQSDTHGPAVALFAAGDLFGIAQKQKVALANVPSLLDFLSGESFLSSDTAVTLQFIERNIPIINVSRGVSVLCEAPEFSRLVTHSRYLRGFGGVLEAAAKRDALIIFAGGNYSIKEFNAIFGANQATRSLFQSNALLVGASTTDSREASFSNSGNVIDIFAPGQYVWFRTFVSGEQVVTKAISGTSFSAPMVAGTATLIKSLFPSITAAKLKSYLIDSSVASEDLANTPVTMTSGDTRPLLNVCAAVRRAQIEDALGRGVAAPPSPCSSFLSQTIAFDSISDQTFGFATPPLQATASSGLVVAFSSLTPSVCAVNATTLSQISPGICTISANQGGNATYAAAAAVTRSFTIAVAPLQTQTITFNPPGALTLGAASSALFASASSSLVVSFSSLTPSVCAVAGTTIALLTPGNCTISASQGGNSVYAAAPVVTRSVTINPAALLPQTITFNSVGNQTLGVAPPPLSATASSNLAVSFSSSTPSICTTAGATLTLLAAGTCTINANQLGNSVYSAAAIVARSFTVFPAPLLTQAITFNSPGNQTLGVPPPALSATATSGLPVTFASTTGAVCAVSGTTLTLITAGTCTIQAIQVGSATYATAATVAQTFTINPAIPRADLYPDYSVYTFRYEPLNGRYSTIVVGGFRVVNVGTASALASTTRFEIISAIGVVWSGDLPTPSIAAGTTWAAGDLSLDLSAVAPCNYTLQITVDAASVTGQSNTANDRIQLQPITLF